MFPTWETHIPSDMCSLPRKHISIVTWVVLPIEIKKSRWQHGTFPLQVNDWFNLSLISTADWSFEYMDIKMSKKRPLTPSFLSLLTSFCWRIQSKAFLKSTKHEKSKFQCCCGLDFTYSSISVFNVKMLSTVRCIFLKPRCPAFMHLQIINFIMLWCEQK